MHVRLSNVAEADLDDIYSHISDNDSRAAERLIDRILSTLYQLERFPLLGRPGRVPGTRELSVPRIPYLIVYSISDAFSVDIETILHTRCEYP